MKGHFIKATLCCFVWYISCAWCHIPTANDWYQLEAGNNNFLHLPRPQERVEPIPERRELPPRATVILNDIIEARMRYDFINMIRSLNQAIEEQVVTIEIVAEVILAAREARDFPLAQIVFSCATERGLINSNIITNFIWLARETGNFPEAESAFNWAAGKNLIDPRSVACFISAAKEARDSNAEQRGWQIAKNKGFVSELQWYEL